MRQAASVFWKDVRHLWPELSVYVVLLASFAIVIPQTWPGSTQNGFMVAFGKLLKVLLALSWLVLITRVVHEDRLVGEEQFWITRPYHWGSLLGAKLLFVGTCVILPFVVMQWEILHMAGLNPFAAKASMAVSLLKFLLIVWLPFMLVASITENLAMAFTTLAGITVLWVGLLTFVLTGTEKMMAPPYILAEFAIVFGGLMIGTLMYQYARRNTTRSRWALAGILLLFIVLLYGFVGAKFGEPVEAIIRHHYPIVSDGSLRMVFNGKLLYEERSEDMKVPPGWIEVKLPLSIAGLGEETKLRNPNVAVTIEDNGEQYASPWQTSVVTERTVGFLLPKHVYDQIADRRPHIHLELVGEKLQRGDTRQVEASKRFSGLTGSECLESHEHAFCRYAYALPTPTRVEAAVSNDCRREDAEQRRSIALRVVPAGTNPDPVVNEPLAFSGKVCQRAMMVFTEYQSVARVRLRIDLPHLWLAEFQAR